MSAPDCPTMVVWESDSTVYAVVSDAPLDTVSSVVDGAAARGSGRAGYRWPSRVPGLDRMAGFLTPLG